MSRLLAPSLLLLFTAACGDLPDPALTDGGEDVTGTDGSATGSGTIDEPPVPSTTSPDPVTTGDTTTSTDPVTTGNQVTDGSTSGDPTTGSTSAGTTTGDTTTGDTTTGDTTTGDTTGDPGPIGPELPAPTVACPDIVDGTVAFHPEGLSGPRDVRIWVDLDTAAELDGPVVFYWYGTGGAPDQALAGVGDLGIQEVLDLGGIVVAPTHDPLAGVFPWWLVLSETQDDLLLADEVLACAQEQIGVDASRIYSLGDERASLALHRRRRPLLGRPPPRRHARVRRPRQQVRRHDLPRRPRRRRRRQLRADQRRLRRLSRRQ